MSFQLHQLLTSCLIFLAAFHAFADSDNAAQPKSSEAIQILFLGDSITEGYGIEKSKAYPELLSQLLNKKHKVKVINAGISGSTTSSAYLRLKAQLKNNIQILVLALGSNDALRGIPTDTAYKNLDKTLQLAKDSKLKVLLVGAKAPPNYGDKYSKSFDQIFLKLKEQHQVSLMPFLLADVAGVPTLNQEDAIHPNEKGHEIIARNMLTYLERLL